VASSEFPSFETVETFLLGRIRALENVENTSTKQGQSQSGSKAQPSGNQQSKGVKVNVGMPVSSQAPLGQKVTHQPRIAAQYPCSYCTQIHFIVACPQFKGLSPADRRKVVIEKSLCFNCLGKHAAKNCNSRSRCKTCNQLHHTMIHLDSAGGSSDLTTVNSNSH